MVTLPVIKIAAQVATTLGVSKVINDIITNNTSVVTNADAVKVATGSLVLGSIVCDAATKHVIGRIDSVATWYNGRNETDTEPTLAQ